MTALGIKNEGVGRNWIKTRNFAGQIREYLVVGRQDSATGGLG